MAFCTKCGKQIEDGTVCDCSANQKPVIPIDTAKAQSFVESMKNRMGIGDPERNATDTYEREMQIVPDSIKPNENEIPVKQYNVAVLRNLLKFERAEGRMQVTNKRVVFRAAGRSIGGRTTLQHEFAIDEIAGIEAIRNFRFGILYMLFGLLVLAATAMLAFTILSGINSKLAEGRYERYQKNTQSIYEKYQEDLQKANDKYQDDLNKLDYSDDDYWENYTKLEEQHNTTIKNLSVQRDSKLEKLSSPSNSVSAFVVVLGLVFGVAGAIPFFRINKKFLLKLLPLGFGTGSFVMLFLSSGNKLLGLFMIVSCLISIFGLALYCLKPNLVISIKNKGAQNPIDIRRDKLGSFGGLFGTNTTGFSEVFPTAESEGAIREINAIITDIQKLGDYGIDKWKK